MIRDWKRISSLLASRRIILAAGFLAVLLTLPSLLGGRLMDDYFHQLMLTHSDLLIEGRSALDLFRFMDGNPEHTQRLMDFGFVPWWTWPNLRAGFWRPVTAITHWIDYQLWPDRSWLMHAQSLAWYGLLAAAVAVLYRRIMGLTWIAGLAGVLYAIDDAHGLPVGWLANRNAIVAAFFGVAAVISHDRWRRSTAAWAGLSATVLMGLSLLSAEAGIATFAYIFAYAVFLDRGNWKSRVWSLVPSAVLIVVWRVAWVMQGYGVDGLGLYTDPLDSPGRFVRDLGFKAPLLLLGQWALPPTDILILLKSHAVGMLWGFAVVTLVIVALLLATVVRDQRTARFWACGMLLSLLPIAATFPSDRLLLFVGIGAMGLLAMFLEWVFSGAASKFHPVLAKALYVSAGVFIVIHLVLAPMGLPIRSGLPLGPTEVVQALEVRVPLDARVTGQSLIIVTAPSAAHAHYLPIIQRLQDKPVPKHTHVLAPAVPQVTVHRPDERSLLVRPANGFYAFPLDQLFRTSEHPFHVGEVVALADMSVVVTALTEDGRPAEALFRFNVPLDSDELRWLRYEDGRFVTFVPPPVGQTVELRADWPWPS